MFKQSRFFFSATMIAILLASTLIFSTDVSAKSRKCPIEPPRTLLSLYLGSKSVFIADIKNEKVTKAEGETEDEDGNYFDIERNLDVVKTFKGEKLKEFSFTKSEYRPNLKSGETGEEEPELIYPGRGYGISTELKVGKRYLFFFSKNDESGEVYPTDYRSAGREMTQENEDIYDKSLSDLGKIIANKKNQIPNIAEWLVDLTENEETRWDGASALSRSFSSLSYEAENGETEEVTTSIEENFGDYSSEIAKNITEAQKERISSVFLTSLNQTLIGSGENNDYDYALAELVAHWDNSRFAMFGFGMLQATDGADVERRGKLMNFVSNMVNDSTLSSTYYKYTEVREISEDAADAESVKTEEPLETAEVKTENTENVAETVEISTTAKEKTLEEELTPAQIREQIFEQFVNRYQELLARNFTPEPEMEVAENTDQ